MVGKIEAADTELVAVIYAPNTGEGIAAAKGTCQMLAESMVTYCQAKIGQKMD